MSSAAWTKLDLEPDVEIHEAMIGETRWRTITVSRGWCLSRLVAGLTPKWKIVRALDGSIRQWATLREACDAAERMTSS